MRAAFNDERLDRLESVLGRLLRGGVLSAAICLTVGLVVWMTAGASTLATVTLTAGLLILMITPIMRVVVSFVAYARMGDWFFVATTVMVFLTLLLAWVLKG